MSMWFVIGRPVIFDACSCNCYLHNKTINNLNKKVYSRPNRAVSIVIVFPNKNYLLLLQVNALVFNKSFRSLEKSRIISHCRSNRVSSIKIQY